MLYHMTHLGCKDCAHARCALLCQHGILQDAPSQHSSLNHRICTQPCLRRGACVTVSIRHPLPSTLEVSLDTAMRQAAI